MSGDARPQPARPEQQTAEPPRATPIGRSGRGCLALSRAWPRPAPPRPQPRQPDGGVPAAPRHARAARAGRHAAAAAAFPAGGPAHFRRAHGGFLRRGRVAATRRPAPGHGAGRAPALGGRLEPRGSAPPGGRREGPGAGPGGTAGNPAHPRGVASKEPAESCSPWDSGRGQGKGRGEASGSGRSQARVISGPWDAQGMLQAVCSGIIPGVTRVPFCGVFHRTRVFKISVISPVLLDRALRMK